MSSDDHTNSLVREHLNATPYVVVVFLLVILVPIIIISNGVIVATTYLLPTLHKPMHHIITALAALDFLIGVLTIPIFILKNIPETWHIFREHKVTCLLSWIVHDFTEYGSLSFLFFMCLERFVCITRPFFYSRHVTGRRIHYVIVFILVIEIIQSLLIYLVFYEFNESEIHLDERCSHYNTPVVFYRYVLPYKIMFCVVGSVFMTIWVGYVIMRTKNEIRRQTLCVGRRSTIGTRRHSKMVLILMVMFVPMWAPGMVVNMVHKNYYYTNPRYANYFDLVTMMLRVLNSGMNAFAYAFTKKTYRVAYFHIMTTPPWKWCEMAAQVRQAVAFSIIVIPTILIPHNTKDRYQSPDQQACECSSPGDRDISPSQSVSSYTLCENV